ncbi:hypothetical protein EN844_31580, partial [Mesorhizobium sp. M3A.F.Ca.ET.201.01.1.1]
GRCRRRIAGIGGAGRGIGGGSGRGGGGAGRCCRRTRRVGGAGRGGVLGGHRGRRARGRGIGGIHGIAERVLREIEAERDRVGADLRIQRLERIDAIGRDGPLLHMHGRALLQGARSAGVGGAKPL